jgi:hypothetical protein
LKLMQHHRSLTALGLRDRHLRFPFSAIWHNAREILY